MKRILFILTFLIFISELIFSQKTITGTVTDDEGDLLPGVSIIAKGTKIGTITLSNGTYSIEITEDVKFLIFSYIGMETIEKQIKGNTVDVIMKPTIDDLDEIVVTSIGTRKKISLRGIASYPKSHSKIRGKKPISYATESVEYDIISSDELSDSEITNKDIKSGMLTAGELNDFGKWELWKDISENKLKTYKSTWKMKPQERYCVQLTNYSNKPIVNAKVLLKTKSGETIWASTTDNTGKAELWANIFGGKYKQKDLFINIIDNKKSYKLSKPHKFQDGINFMSIPADCNVPEIANIAFVVDATGSMGDEISYLKAELQDVLNKIKKQHTDLTVNSASVFYRDKSDAYLVRKSDFSEDVKTTIDFINKQSPGGGGDFPEAVDAGLNEAINELSWSNNALAKVIFLILDAPPHNDSSSVKNMQELSKKASEKGIRIVPVTASGINKSTEYLMRSIALATNGTYVFLTDDSGIGNAHIKPTTDEFQVELLNDVFIRLIKQYLTIPDCKEEIVYNEEEIQDTSFIADNIVIQDSTEIDTTKKINIIIKPEIGKVKYYPNPTSDILNIEITGDMKEMFLADISGKILQKFDIKNKKKFNISLSKFPAGIYFIQYQNGERWQTGKVIHTHLM